MRTNLVVPFAEKDRAKRLGARWDAARKVWYVEGLENISAFSEWLPGHSTKAGIGTEKIMPTAIPVPGKTAKSHGVERSAGVMTGTKPLSHSCDCLPWLGCEKCLPVLEAMGWRAKV